MSNVKRPGDRRCKNCGCTEEKACAVVIAGVVYKACHWRTPDTCSFCYIADGPISIERVRTACVVARMLDS